MSARGSNDLLATYSNNIGKKKRGILARSRRRAAIRSFGKMPIHALFQASLGFSPKLQHKGI
jgi:hypothetical protein